MAALLRLVCQRRVCPVYALHTKNRLPRQQHYRFSAAATDEQRILIALGGNAIQKSTEKGTADEMMNNINSACKQMCTLITENNSNNQKKLIITHGNGPQIGSLYLQNQTCAQQTPAMPLYLCGAATQGMIGYMLQQSLFNTLSSQDHSGLQYNVMTHITQVLVDEQDEAWNNPTKPIGKYYSKEESERIQADDADVVMLHDKVRGGYRIAVASPKPIDIVEHEKYVINTLLQGREDHHNNVLIACGGGGIPVIQEENGMLRGCDKCVIDKDLTAVKLAMSVGAEYLIIATDVECVYLDFLSDADDGKARKKAVARMSVKEAQQYYEEGQFGKGSMGPKVLAGIQFVSQTGQTCIICALSDIEKAIKGQAGTSIVP
mmetsp:Transcript_28438/g.44971  ORF Transcript_28438/g.44971 Transcript_28438/m.44971 type:complete len:376 (-) Transcript_28438:35-1162(-)